MHTMEIVEMIDPMVRIIVQPDVAATAASKDT